MGTVSLKSPRTLIDTDGFHIMTLELSGKEKPGLYSVTLVNTYNDNFEEVVFTGPKGQAEEVFEGIESVYYTNMSYDIPTARDMSPEELSEESDILYMQTGVNPVVTLREFKSYRIFMLRIEHASDSDDEESQDVLMYADFHDRRELLEALKNWCSSDVFDVISEYVNSMIDRSLLKSRIEALSAPPSQEFNFEGDE